MSRELLVASDHDGFLTDPVKIDLAYADVLCGGLAETFSLLNRKELLDELRETKISMLANPQFWGWKGLLNNGIVVGAATADPLIFNRVAVMKLVNDLRTKDGSSRLPNDNDLAAEITRIFRRSYKDISKFYRPDAIDFITEVDPLGKLIIVSGGDTTAIKENLAEFMHANGKNIQIPVIGNARKFDLDLTMRIDPAEITPRGFPWPVMLQRKWYHEALFKHNGMSPDVAAGDVYDADLSVPEHVLKIPTFLIVSKFTAPWEAAYYDNHPTGYKADSLAGVTQQLLKHFGK